MYYKKIQSVKQDKTLQENAAGCRNGNWSSVSEKGLHFEAPVLQLRTVEGHSVLLQHTLLYYDHCCQKQ